MPLTYQTELLSNIMDEVKSLILHHWRDVSDGSEGEPDPQWDTMLKLEEQGIWKTITARDEGKLVGYIMFIVAPHLHYRKILVAHDDAFFMLRDYRKGHNGIKLFQYAEQYLREIGVNRITYHEKTRAPLGKFLAYLGFRNVERNWFKDL